MHCVHDHGFEIGKEGRAVFLRHEQGQLLGRGQQNVGRGGTLAGAFRLRRIAGTRLDAKVQPHLVHRHHQIARHVL